jgi:hypothetical protein
MSPCPLHQALPLKVHKHGAQDMLTRARIREERIDALSHMPTVLSDLVKTNVGQLRSALKRTICDIHMRLQTGYHQEI